MRAASAVQITEICCNCCCCCCCFTALHTVVGSACALPPPRSSRHARLSFGSFMCGQQFLASRKLNLATKNTHTHRERDVSKLLNSAPHPDTLAVVFLSTVKHNSSYHTACVFSGAATSYPARGARCGRRSRPAEARCERTPPWPSSC